MEGSWQVLQGLRVPLLRSRSPIRFLFLFPSSKPCHSVIQLIYILSVAAIGRVDSWEAVSILELQTAVSLGLGAALLIMEDPFGRLHLAKVDGEIPGLYDDVVSPTKGAPETHCSTPETGQSCSAAPSRSLGKALKDPPRGDDNAFSLIIELSQVCPGLGCNVSIRS